MTVDLAFAYLGHACHDVAACSDKRFHTELRGRILGRHQRFTAYDLNFVFQKHSSLLCFVFSFCNNVFYIGLTPFDFGQQKILPPKTSEEGSDIKYSILLSSGVKLSYCHRDTSSPWFNRTHFCAGEVKLYAVTVVLSHIDRSVYTRFDGKLLCHTRCRCVIRLGILRPLTDKTLMRCFVNQHPFGCRSRLVASPAIPTCCSACSFCKDSSCICVQV